MNDKTVGDVHWSYWLIGVVALLFNAGGTINFFAQMNADAVAQMPKGFRAIIEGRPIWATGAFAIAVFGGTIGSVLLLMKKSAAYYLFIASLAGVIVQVIPFLGMIGSTVAFDPVEIAAATVVSLVVAAFLIWYTKRVERRGWIA